MLGRSVESAYFAREEAAKSAVVFAAAHTVATDPSRINWKAFWGIWRDHQKKSAGFVMMSRLYDRLFERGNELEADDKVQSEEALQLRKERESALYVNWDGGIQTPWDSITADRARQMVGEARKVVEVELASTDAHRRNIDNAARASEKRGTG